jgi:hypothetical protein
MFSHVLCRLSRKPMLLHSYSRRQVHEAMHVEYFAFSSSDYESVNLAPFRRCTPTMRYTEQDDKFRVRERYTSDLCIA